MSIETEKILNSLDNVEDKLNYAERVALWYDSTEDDKKLARKIIHEEAGKQNPHADFLMYKLYMADENIPSAMDFLKRAYYKKYPQALAFTYFEYLFGYATFVTDAEARRALFTAINQNIPAAHYFHAYALKKLSFKFPSLECPSNASIDERIDMINKFTDYVESGQQDRDIDIAQKKREDASDSLYNKAIGLGFSEKSIYWPCHQQAVQELSIDWIYYSIIPEVFTNTTTLLNHINNKTIRTYLVQCCRKNFNEYCDTQGTWGFYKPMLNVELIDINSLNKYCLYIEAIEPSHKFYRMLPIYYMAILDRSGGGDNYLFTGRPRSPFLMMTCTLMIATIISIYTDIQTMKCG